MKKILTIEDYVSHWLIRIFGIKIKIKRNASTLVAENQKKKINEIRNKIGKEKIRVGFLVSESSKWSYGSIYDLFERNPRYEPVILITQLEIVHSGKTADYLPIEECFNFFKDQGYRVDWAYDNASNSYLDIDEKKIDLLFYQQPWELPPKQMPACVSKSALTLYVPYGENNMPAPEEYMRIFHGFLWKYFIKNKEYQDDLERSVGYEFNNCYCVGSPKLDVYLTGKETKVDKIKPKIIYAPHHSFEESSLRTATFQSNGKQILELAERTSKSIDWVLRPHPRFKMAVIHNGIMNREEIDDYYKRWRKIGDICEGGDYFKLFKSSSGLITDCISFLAEYLPTKAPVFRLVNDKQRVAYSRWMEIVLRSYYNEGTYNDFERDFKRVILNGDDWKFDERVANVPLVVDYTSTSASKVFDIIEEEFL